MRIMAEGIQGLCDYFTPFIEERLNRPHQDLMSVLAAGEREGTLNRSEVLANTILLLMAGHETTISLISNGILTLLEHPGEWARLQAKPALAAAATEEVLRYDSPVKSLHRICAAEIEIGGKRICELDRIRWIIAAANRDPDVFAEPDRFDITRHPNPHVAFGSGIHHCLGAPLARLEGQEVFKALAERFPLLQLQDRAMQYEPSLTFRTPKRVALAWS
jgi:cytochrome P450